MTESIRALVERLRWIATRDACVAYDWGGPQKDVGFTCDVAADALERLARERDEAMHALDSHNCIVRELHGELAEAREDTARLDWYDHNAYQITDWGAIGGEVITLRQRIDAARAAEKEKV